MKAIQLQQKFSEIHNFYELQDYASAQVLVEAHLRQIQSTPQNTPEKYEFFAYLGYSCYKGFNGAKSIGQALRYLSLAIESSDDELKAFSNQIIGFIHYNKTKNFKAAYDHLMASLENTPQEERHNTHYYLGQILYFGFDNIEKNYKLAHDYFNYALQSNFLSGTFRVRASKSVQRIKSMLNRTPPLNPAACAVNKRKLDSPIRFPKRLRLLHKPLRRSMSEPSNSTGAAQATSAESKGKLTIRISKRNRLSHGRDRPSLPRLGAADSAAAESLGGIKRVEKSDNLPSLLDEFKELGIGGPKA